MLKDTNWLSWISKLPLYLYGMFYATFRLVFSGEAVSHLISEFLKVDVKFHSLERIIHTVVLNCVMGSWAVKHHIAAHSHFNFAHYSWQKCSSAFYTSSERWGEIETHRSVSFRYLPWLYSLFQVIDQSEQPWVRIMDRTPASFFYMGLINFQNNNNLTFSCFQLQISPFFVFLIACVFRCIMHLDVLTDSRVILLIFTLDQILWQALRSLSNWCSGL